MFIGQNPSKSNVRGQIPTLSYSLLLFSTKSPIEAPLEPPCLKLCSPASGEIGEIGTPLGHAGMAVKFSTSRPTIYAMDWFVGENLNRKAP